MPIADKIAQQPTHDELVSRANDLETQNKVLQWVLARKNVENSLLRYTLERHRCELEHARGVLRGFRR